MTDSFGLDHPAGHLDSDHDGFGDSFETASNTMAFDSHHHPVIDGTDHAHMRPSSEAIDTDDDGISNAVELRLGTDPLDARNHPLIGGGEGDHADADGDIFPDSVELAIGTDPMSGASHPIVVEAHHFPAGSEQNLPDTIDLSVHSWLGAMP